MASFLDNTRNLSLYTIPAAWILSIAPHFYAVSLAASKFDNSHPRSLTGKLESDQSIDKATKGKIVRAEGAQQNGFENIGLFAAAVVAANVAGVKAETLNYLSMGYLASRVVYNVIYITNETPAASNARTGVFLTGIGIIFTLFVKSGNAINASKFNKY